MKQNILQLAQVYHLDPLLFTKKINVSSRLQSHSHPVLTLNTRFAREPNKILSLWLHEEFHWWAAMNVDKMRAAVKDLQELWTKVPLEGKKGGQVSTYVHLIICWLEHRALEHYLGKSTADSVVREFIKKHQRYPWAFSQVLNKGFAIERIVKKQGLIPFPLAD